MFLLACHQNQLKLRPCERPVVRVRLYFLPLLLQRFLANENRVTLFSVAVL